MSHLKRRSTPVKWPMPKKGTTFVVRPNFDRENGVPILIAIRDMLKLAKNRKEVKKALHEKIILINNHPVKDEKNSLLYLDILTLTSSKKSYRLELNSHGKFELIEIPEKETHSKISKIINKTILKGKKTQINLLDGRNILSNINCNVNDSVLINLKDKKIEKCIPLKEKSNVAILTGKHIGKKGVIEKIDFEKKMAKIKSNGEEINVLIKQLLAIE